MFTRNFSLLLGANMIMGSAMPMLIILGGFAGIQLSPSPLLATLPPTVQLIVGVIVAAPISVFMGRFGRKTGFALACVLFILGGFVGVAALLSNSFVALCFAHVILGAGLICVGFFRFAAADAVPEQHKPQAMSYVIASGLVAALLGPQLFSLFKDVLAPVSFAGAYLAISGIGFISLFPIAGLCLEHKAANPRRIKRRGLNILRSNPKITRAIAVAGFSQTMMVFLMIPTPLAMVACGLNADQAADVISWHVIAMFAPGLATGALIGRFGCEAIASAGIMLLLVSAIIPLMGQTAVTFYAALITLGVGWNLGFVGGSQMLQQATPIEDRPLVQGLNEMILAICASVASLAAGITFALLGWLILTCIAAIATCIAMAFFYIRCRPI